MTEQEWLAAEVFYQRDDVSGSIWHYSVMMWIVHFLTRAI